ncbi:uncharacterized protein LOC122502246 [Leptopilina heterotoma]|uniref:uncharacterized protein LOC122502246 n=1 Tax=Leptopilina heterotoma TaxID=63436 RepID=UPI001CA7EA92|nr:uncharacterized protein LOC122502246 [Leptopilina heterotoma]
MDIEFYPNACFICQATDDLKRCSRCKMISYCSEVHQMDHWPEHKDLCKTIHAMMKEEGVSHLYEKLRGCDVHTWRKEKMRILEEIESRCPKLFENPNAAFLLYFPRSCFVCYESRQTLLKNCPGCPVATFCKDHPSSSIHDKDCANLKKSFQLRLQLSNRIKKGGEVQLQMLATSVLHAIQLSPTLEKITNMGDFLEKFSKSKNLSLNVGDDLKYWLTVTFGTILSTFNALQILELTTLSKLTIYMKNLHQPDYTEFWEALLHLIPDLKELTILFIDPAAELGIKPDQMEICRECKKKEKKLTLGFLASCYEDCEGRNIAEPNILMATDIVDPETTDVSEVKVLPSLLKFWSRFNNCPLIVTTIMEEYREEMKNTIQSTLGDVDYIFDDSNPFKSHLSIRTNYNRAGVSNNFMVILKPKPKVEVEVEVQQN